MTSNYNWKIAIIGEGSVGKTSLVNRFVSNKFQDSYSETVGIDMFNHEIIINEGITISLLIYDFGGQEYWKNLRTSFYQRSRGVILVYDVTNPDSFNSLESWYNEANENIGYPVPTVILGNKDDLVRQVTNAQLTVPFISNNSIKTFYTSAKTGDMVLEAFTEICNQIYNKFKSKD